MMMKSIKIELKLLENIKSFVQCVNQYDLAINLHAGRAYVNQRQAENWLVAFYDVPGMAHSSGQSPATDDTHLFYADPAKRPISVQDLHSQILAKRA